MLSRYKEMSKNIPHASEEELLRKIVESMGIEEYDPLLITALCEYTRSMGFSKLFL